MKQEKLIFEDAIRDIMLRIGLFFDDVSIDEDIQTILSESIIFITFIIEIEQEFNIEIPEQYLNPETIGSLRQLDSLLLELVSQNKKVHGWESIKNKFKNFFKKLYISSTNRKQKNVAN